MGSGLRKHKRTTQVTVKEYNGELSTGEEIISQGFKRSKQTGELNIECTNSSKESRSGEGLETGGKVLKTKALRGSERESRFIKPSEFPYRKPKFIPYKPRNHVGKTRVDILRLPEGPSKENLVKSRTCGITNITWPSQTCGMSKVEFLRSKTDAWAPGVYPTDKPLLHKTVANLRGTALDDQWGTPDLYKSNNLYYPRLHPGHEVMIDRPPTPCPWLPIRRTEDYLVASSLHAYERKMDEKRGLVCSPELPDE